MSLEESRRGPPEWDPKVERKAQGTPAWLGPVVDDRVPSRSPRVILHRWHQHHYSDVAPCFQGGEVLLRGTAQATGPGFENLVSSGGLESSTVALLDCRGDLSEASYMFVI